MKGNFVLSGGGARGYAHLGVMKALQEWGIQPKAISGVSAGAVFAAFICDGFQIQEIEEIFLSHKIRKQLNFHGFKNGFLTLRDLENLMRKNLRTKKIESLKIPLHITVSDLEIGEEKIFSEGELVPTILASCAVPGVFPPQKIDGRYYADGGINCNFPTKVFEGNELPLIGISVNPPFSYEAKNGWLLNLDRTLNIMLRQMAQDNMKKCHIIIEPPFLKSYHVFQIEKRKEIMEKSYTFMLENYKRENLISLFPC